MRHTGPACLTSALTAYVRRVGSCGGLGSSPALLAFAADAGAFLALGGEDVGVAGVGIAPAQVRLQPPSQDRVVGVVRGAHDEGAQRPELGCRRS